MTNSQSGGNEIPWLVNKNNKNILLHHFGGFILYVIQGHWGHLELPYADPQNMSLTQELNFKLLSHLTEFTK